MKKACNMPDGSCESNLGINESRGTKYAQYDEILNTSKEKFCTGNTYIYIFFFTRSMLQISYKETRTSSNAA